MQETNRQADDFKAYEFSCDNNVELLEEFVVPHNNLTDHCLYTLTHCQSFSNLRVLDLRNNKIESLLTLIVSHAEFRAHSLEELYLSTTVGSRDSSYNISFFFTGIVRTLSNLKVLWLEAKNNRLFAQYEKEKMIRVRLHRSNSFSNEECRQPLAYDCPVTKMKNLNLAFKKLYLKGVNFPDELGQDLLNSLRACEDLTLSCWEFTKLDKNKPLKYLTALKSLSLKNCKNVYAALNTSRNLHWTLETLKIQGWVLSSCFIAIVLFSNLKHLRFAEIKNTEVLSIWTSFPDQLKTIEIIRCSVSKISVLNILALCPSESNVVLLDNKYNENIGKDISAMKSPSGWTKLMFDDNFTNFIFGYATNPLYRLPTIFPDLKKVCYYKNVLKNKALRYSVNNPIANLVGLINSGKTNIEKFTLVKEAKHDEDYWYRDRPRSKCKGLFEYKVNSSLTIDSMLDS